MSSSPHIDDLEAWFKTAKLPPHIRLSNCEKITDVKGFVETHIGMLRANSGNKTFKPYYDRLKALKEILEFTQTQEQ